jgi:hypothetical protein
MTVMVRFRVVLLRKAVKDNYLRFKRMELA